MRLLEFSLFGLVQKRFKEGLKTKNGPDHEVCIMGFSINLAIIYMLKVFHFNFARPNDNPDRWTKLNYLTTT